jgi:hypothetical protein
MKHPYSQDNPVETVQVKRKVNGVDTPVALNKHEFDPAVHQLWDDGPVPAPQAPAPIAPVVPPTAPVITPVAPPKEPEQPPAPVFGEKVGPFGVGKDEANNFFVINMVGERIDAVNFVTDHEAWKVALDLNSGK